jgi:uncharacterized membrane protein YphA (DoxX/SURF4 family)
MPGVGLLLLRAAVAAAALAQAGPVIFHVGALSVMTWMWALLMCTAAGSLLVGFLTPAVSAAVAAAFLARLLAVAPEPASLGSSGAVLFLANAIAIVLIGPGAFSIDARLFGRREIVIPHERPAAG